MKKIVIALLAALMVGSTFLTACSGEAPSSVSEETAVSADTEKTEASIDAEKAKTADVLLREIIGNCSFDSGVTVSPEYDKEGSSAYIYVDGKLASRIDTDGNTVTFIILMPSAGNVDEVAVMTVEGVSAIIAAKTPSISQSAEKDILDGVAGAVTGSSYSKTVGDITYSASASDDGYILFMAYKAQ